MGAGTVFVAVVVCSIGRTVGAPAGLVNCRQNDQRAEVTDLECESHFLEQGVIQLRMAASK